MRRYYKGQDRDVFRTLWQKEDFDLQDTSTVYLRITLRHGLDARGAQEKETKTKEDMADNIQRDLQLRGISRCEVEAAERTRWQYLAACCPAKDRRNSVLSSTVVQWSRIKNYFRLTHGPWRSKVGVGPYAKNPKGPLVPLITLFVCSANKQSPHSGNFWVGLIGLKFVIQAKVRDFR